MKKITIKDVARMAGVSEASVSYCLNGVKGRLSEETEKKILEVVSRYGYVPSFSARTLVLGKTDILGVVTVNLLGEPFAEALKGIEEQSRKHSLNILIGDAQGIYERESEYAEMLLHKGVEGLIFISASSQKDNEILHKISRIVPAIFINRPLAGENFYRIVFENRRVMKQLVNEIIKRDAREILFLTQSAGTWAFSERLKGYQESVEEAGLKQHVFVFDVAQSEEEKEKIIRDFIRSRKFSAFVCSSNQLAILVWKTACTEGFRIGVDISLTAFDDTGILKHLIPPITTIRQPFFEAGVLAVDIFLQLKKGKKVKKVWELDSEIIWRESVRNYNSQFKRVN
ncbi:MAG: LacI family transcriptional regulator [Candidatus Omnitrophica bacterium]|nr:LacI family transcriptional regulator [Candidatus Omnitrophota bacterium]